MPALQLSAVRCPPNQQRLLSTEGALEVLQILPPPPVEELGLGW